MKYNYLFSIIFLLASTIPTYAQKNTNSVQPPKNVKVTWSKMADMPKKSTMEGVVGSDEQGAYALRCESRGLFSNTSALKAYSVDFYNENMSLSRSTPLGSKDTEDNDFERLVVLSDRLAVFSSTYEKSSRLKKLFVHTIDKKTMKLNKDKQQIGEVTLTKDPDYRGGFTIRASADESKILVVTDAGYDKNQPERFSLQVFDSNLKSAWNQKITLPYPEERIEIKGYQVDDNGNVYMSGKLYDKVRKGLFGGNTTREVEGGTPNYKYVLIAYMNEGKSTNEYAIDFEKFIVDMSYRVDAQGNVICGGLYSEYAGGLTNSVKGCFSMTIDVQNKKVLKKAHRAFSASTKDDFMGERRAKNSKSELFSFNLSDLVLRSDGGQILVAEQQYVRAVTRSQGAFSYTRYLYYYNDLIVININPDGKIDWTTRIPKAYVAESTYYSSYAMFPFKDKLYFVFNDDARNVLKPQKRTYLLMARKLKSAVTTLVTIDTKGNMTRSIVGYNKQNGVVMVPRLSHSLSENKLLLYGQDKRGKHLRFGTMELK